MNEEKDFKRGKIDSLTLGERLEKLRENQQVQLKKLASKLKIKQAYLKALETGDYQSLPTKVYVRGFVRSYARYFRVSESKLINLFEREYRIYKNIHNKDNQKIETINRLPELPRLVLTFNGIIAIITFVSIALATLYLFFGFQKFISAPWLIIEEPISGETTNAQEILVKGQTKSDAQIFINDQIIQVDLGGYFSEQIGLSSGMNTITIKSINKFEKESVETIIVHAQYEEKDNNFYQEENKVEKVSLRLKVITNPIWVKVSVDDILIYEDMIGINEEKEFFANEKIVISSGDGKNTLVSVDGKDFVNLNDEIGSVKNVVFLKEVLDE